MLRASRYLPLCRDGIADIVADAGNWTYAGACRIYAEDVPTWTDPEVALFGANDRFFLLTELLHRKDARHPWLYDRCREVEAKPYGYVDLWAREHYKALDVDTPIWTTAGWKRHGDLRFGDRVFAPNGRIVRIIANTGPMEGADCYDVGGVVAAGDHLWPTQVKHRARVVGGREVYYSTSVCSTREMGRVRLPHVFPLDGQSPSFMVPPYTLGVWLGDGHAACGRVTSGDADLWSFLEWRVKTQSVATLRNLPGLMPLLREIGVLNNKHVPIKYLTAAPLDRLALLQGLMDTDGHCNTRGTATFVNTNERLADAVAILAGSLGMRAKKRRYENNHAGFWQVSFQARPGRYCPFQLPRKRARTCRKTVRMRTVEPRPVTTRAVNCIQVEGGMYLAGRDLLPTHNSTIITFAGTVQEILCDPEITIGIFSATVALARGFLRQVMDEFEGNERLKRLYADVLWEKPKTQASVWSKDEGIVVRRQGNPREPTLSGWGLLDGMPTGFHFRLRKYDDVITEKNVTNPDQIQKITERWELSDNLGAGEALLEVIGTRYFQGDTYEIMMDRGAVIPRVYPATAKPDGSPGGRDDKPVFFTAEQWEAKKRTQRTTLAAQMLQNPLADGQAIFDPLTLKPFTLRPRTLNIYILGDYAGANSKTSDKTAFAVIGIDHNDNKYLLDGFCHRMSLTQKWDCLAHLYTKWVDAMGVQSVQVGYERYGAQSDIQHFEHRMEEKDSPKFAIMELNYARDLNDQSKKARVARLEPDFTSNSFYLPAKVWRPNASWWIDARGNERPGPLPESEEGTQHVGARVCLWSVNPNDGRIIYRPIQMDGQKIRGTKEDVAAKRSSETYRLVHPIKRYDADDNVYDLTHIFFEQFKSFPLSSQKDLIDAASRIYDMNPTTPMIIERELLETPVYID